MKFMADMSFLPSSHDGFDPAARSPTHTHPRLAVSLEGECSSPSLLVDDHDRLLLDIHHETLTAGLL